MLSACNPGSPKRLKYSEDENVYPKVTKMIFNISSDEAIINMKKVKAPPAFISENGTALIPLDVFCEGVGALEEWNEAEKKAEIKSDGINISVSFDKGSITLNGRELQTADKPEIKNGAAMIPANVFADAFGALVRYDDEKNRIIIDKRSSRTNWRINTAMLEEIKEFILKKTDENSASFNGRVPHATDKSGKYKLMNDPGWVAGFYTGLNYLCYDWSGDEKYIDYAKEVFPMLSYYLYNKPEFYHHDLGFTFTLSYYQDYLLNKKEESKIRVIDAADVLMGRFTDEGYIRGWNVWGEDEFAKNNRYRMICDSMCNIPILFIASSLTGNEKYYGAAVSQADLTIKYLIRDDFTTTHTYVFPHDGKPGFEQQHQGAYDTSCWSRGHAWVINGMAQAYKYTDNEKYLQAAKDLADAYLIMTDEDLIPHWDFIFKGNNYEPRDTSAAAITACGLCDIYDSTGDEFYKDIAYKILCGLYENYSSVNEPDNQGIINHATGNKPQHQNIDISLIYGDYYFALLTDRFCGYCGL